MEESLGGGREKIRRSKNWSWENCRIKEKKGGRREKNWRAEKEISYKISKKSLKGKKTQIVEIIIRKAGERAQENWRRAEAKRTRIIWKNGKRKN